MMKEKLSPMCAGYIILLTITASHLLLGFPHSMGQDAWIAVLFSAVWALPALLLYARLVRLMPGMDIYEMARSATGSFCAKIIAALFSLYCLHVAALVLNSYMGFAHMTSLFKTPPVIITLVLSAAGIYLAKSGAAALEKWSSAAFAVLAAALLVTAVFSAREFNYKNLLPVMEHSIEEIAGTSLGLTSFPLGDSVIILALVHGLDRKVKPFRLFALAATAAAVLLALVFVQACGLLGVEGVRAFYFPYYKAAGLIRIGSFLERMEALVGMVFILTATVKISAGLIGACRGAAGLLGIPSFRTIVIPMGLTAAAWASFMFANMVEIVDFMKVYPYYAPFFQVLIPLAIWLPAEIRAKKGTLPIAPEGQET